MKKALAVTMGDPAGIGPELCLSVLGEAQKLGCVPILFGDAKLLKRVAKQLALPMDFAVLTLAQWEKAKAIESTSIVDCQALDAAAVRPGEISAAAGKAAYVYIERAIHAALSGRVQGVVTAPLNKEALRLAGITYPGHTEIFTSLTGAKRSCMMLRSEPLTVSLVTTHIGYGEVLKKLSVERVLDVIELTAEAMQRMLRRAPRLVICGLNPHAG